LPSRRSPSGRTSTTRRPRRVRTESATYVTSPRQQLVSEVVITEWPEGHSQVDIDRIRVSVQL
jgi:hypothetical protein